MSLLSTARIVNKSGAQIQDPRGFFNREFAFKYSLPRGNSTRYTLGTLADFIGCNARDIYWAVEGAGKDKAIVALTNGLQKSVDYVYLQPVLVRTTEAIIDLGIKSGELIAKEWADQCNIGYERNETETYLFNQQ